MDFSKQLDSLEQHATDAKNTALAAVSESRDELQQRIDQAEVQVHLGLQTADQHADELARKTQGRWAQTKADVAARMDEAKTRVGKHVDALDAKAAGMDADMAESDAADAIDFAEWAVDNARLSVLSAIDARAYADERAARS